MTSDRTVAIAQVGLSTLFIIGYFAVLVLFLTGHIRTPPDWKDQLGVLLGVITGSLTTIVAFWFSRSRPQT
jgi:hypothetical protein